jgi:hypothetical protein
MNRYSLSELEAAMLKKRLKYLRSKGITGKSTRHGFGDDFFNHMEDQWIFCAALMDIYGVKDMQDRRQDDEVAQNADFDKRPRAKRDIPRTQCGECC